LYASLEELFDTSAEAVLQADLVIVGSYVMEGIDVGRWVIQQAQGTTAFYDIDTPITLTQIGAGQCKYIDTDLVPRYDLYLSFAGGPVLQRLEQSFGSPCARPLYCSVDPDLYYHQQQEKLYDLGYMGTYSSDRQPGLESLLLEPARQWPA